MKRDPVFRPTLWGTLCQMAAVCRAIWADYADSARAQRRLRRQYPHVLRTTGTPGWRSDACHLAVATLTAVAALAWALYIADAWGPVLAWLGVM